MRAVRAKQLRFLVWERGMAVHEDVRSRQYKVFHGGLMVQGLRQKYQQLKKAFKRTRRGE